MTEAAMRRSIGLKEDMAMRIAHADAHEGGAVPDKELRRSKDWDAVDETLLIAKVRRMIRAIGLPHTVRLLETWGGTYLELPQGRLWRKQSGALAALLGQDAADAFHAEFAHGERRILLPKVDKILIQLRDRQICAESEDISARDQALRYRLTERQIHKIRARGWRRAEARPTPQLSLFSGSSSDCDPGDGRECV
jgi:hypothetical protein